MDQGAGGLHVYSANTQSHIRSELSPFISTDSVSSRDEGVTSKTVLLLKEQ